MTQRIIVTGRGGTGKTTFAALAGRFLPSPKLLIDADPDECLAHMLGVDLESAGIRTISDALYSLQKGKAAKELDAMPLAERVQYLLHMSCLYESEGFDLLTLGVKWTRGCYCAPNATLQEIISGIVSGYRFAVLDSPAGLEHLNRRVLTRAEDVFAVVDPSAKSLRNVEVVRELADSIGFRFENLYLVANHRFPKDQIARLKKVKGTTYLGKVEPDAAVQESDWAGRSLLELPEDSPACASVRAILGKAGYVCS